MIIFTMKSFLVYLFHWYLSYIITIPAVHHPIKSSYLHFELAPALLDVSFGIISWISLGTNHLKNYLEKHFCPGTLLNTNETLLFFLFCFNKNLKSFCDLKGHNISLSRCVPLLSFQYTMSNNLSCCYLYCLFIYLFIYSFLKPIST